MPLLADDFQAPPRQQAGRWPFALLAILLCITFATGGSSWPTEPGLPVLRSAALLVAAVGVWTVRLEQWRKFAAIWIVFLSMILLIGSHLIPLPFAVWSALPGRQIIADIDAAAGLGQIARPLTMIPEDTANALWSMSVPFAVLILAMQLDTARHRLILGLVICLIAVSGLIGTLQAGGASIQFYADVSDTPGVFANRNHQAALLAMLFPMAAAISSAGLGAAKPGRISTLIAIGLAVITVPLVVVTGSRSGLLASSLAIALSPLLLIASGRVGHRPLPRSTRWLIFAAGAGFLALLVGVTMLSSRDIAIDRLGTVNHDERWPLWQSVIAAIPRYMPWGSGIGTFADVYKIGEPDALLSPAYFNHAHNDWLEIPFTAGIPGLAITACSAALFAFGAFRALRARGTGAVFARLGLIMILILAAASITDYPVRTPIMMAMLALASVWASAARGFVEPPAERT